MDRGKNKFILLSDTGNDCLLIFDGKTGKFQRKIAIGNTGERGPHGMTVCGDGRFVCFSNSFGSSISLFDAESMDEIQNIGTGATPCHIAEKDKKLYISNFDSDSISVVDEEEQAAVISIGTGRMPHGLCCWGNRIFVAESGSDSVGVIETGTDFYAQRINLNCAPVHMDIVNGSDLLAAACTDYGIDVRGCICIIDMKSGKVEERIRMGHCLTDIVSDDGGKYVYVSDGGSGCVYKVN